MCSALRLSPTPWLIAGSVTDWTVLPGASPAVLSACCEKL
jgi:hypothetical protein